MLAALLFASGSGARAQIARVPLIRSAALTTPLPAGLPGLRQIQTAPNLIRPQAVALAPVSALTPAPLPLIAPRPQLVTPRNAPWSLSPGGVYIPASPVPTALETAQALQAQTGLRDSRGPALDSAFDGALSRAGRAAVPPAGPAGPLSAQLSDKTGAALLAELHDISGRNYRVHEYSEASKYLFATADNVTVNGVRGVIDAYSDIFVAGSGDHGDDYPEHGDQNGDGTVDRGMNVEHVWPQSFFSKKLPMRSDLHHLMATFKNPNSIRSNLPFGEVTGRPEYSNKAGAKMGGGIFEPPSSTKGRVARAMLYFYMRYYDKDIRAGDFGLGFFAKRLDMFLRWNRQHPPDANEIRRNGLVESFQGNRNPFVDDPTLADRIGIDGFLSKFSSAGKTFVPRNILQRLEKARAEQRPATRIRGFNYNPN